jgi:hypothetical protein
MSLPSAMSRLTSDNGSCTELIPSRTPWWTVIIDESESTGSTAIVSGQTAVRTVQLVPLSNALHHRGHE